MIYWKSSTWLSNNCSHSCESIFAAWLSEVVHHHSETANNDRIINRFFFFYINEWNKFLFLGNCIKIYAKIKRKKIKQKRKNLNLFSGLSRTELTVFFWTFSWFDDRNISSRHLSDSNRRTKVLQTRTIDHSVKVPLHMGK